ncbi:polyprenyl synthetase family protein [Bacteroidetes/Chlorobi group bacterium Naka2016]|nr:MAG: polyprenyl synthetase family protein [Bacteroidetes/Chlorobi group bacterium Naka2016]
MKVLDQITLPVSKELEKFEDYFRSVLKTDIGLLDTVIRYLVSRKGKRIRPLLIFLSANLVGEANERTFIGATMVELLHTATLVHDDVVDEAQERRGILSINAKWNNKIAVLLGDFLLAKGLLIAIENDEFEFLHVLSEAVKLMSEGELLQIQTSREFEIDENRYFEIIYSKTASLISACCEIGCLSVTDDKEKRAKLKEFGRLIGLAFQIRDDIFDYIGKTSIIGKPVGNDIREKKITLPLIYALQKVSDREAKAIVNIVKSNKKRKDVKEVIDFVIENDGIGSAQATAIDFINKAKSILQEFPINSARESLLRLADYIVEREK